MLTTALDASEQSVLEFPSEPTFYGASLSVRHFTFPLKKSMLILTRLNDEPREKKFQSPSSTKSVQSRY
jgi:hypothetical protein